MISATMERTGTLVVTDASFKIPEVCESLLDGKRACKGPATVLVRFQSHGCGRDGKGVLLCKDCRDWIASFAVGCGYCDQSPPEVELFIVSSVGL